MRVAVLAGGRSSEHDVSLSSAASVRDGLEAAGHEVIGVDLERDGTWRHEGEELALRPGRGLLGAGAVFPALHGPFGEDGTVQGLLELLDVAYVGAGVLSSAVCMDKAVFKELMARAGLPQVGFVAVDEGVRDGVVQRVAGLGRPCWVKPARLGSSVGIVRVGEGDDLEGALETAFGHDPRVIVESSATGVEVECSVLGHTGAPEASEPGEIVLLRGEGWYDYEAKYTDGGMELVVPARISPAAREQVRELAITAFRLAGCSGLARADFFVDGDTVLLNELNTMPGFTATSVYAKLWESSGLPYPDLVDLLVRIAVERFERERAHRF
ncbi:MAG: D-alanine-D-alanine ligase [Solirubrobacteraceae bacterium]|nr:D-alanine-D-alanine ligase [Solirubrobacteraceae bacterium]